MKGRSGVLKVIRLINDYLVKASEGIALKESNRFDEGALYESQIHLEVWLKRKSKKTLVETFKEYKRDILDDFDKCISFGNANNLWENMD